MLDAPFVQKQLACAGASADGPGLGETLMQIVEAARAESAACYTRLMAILLAPDTNRNADGEIDPLTHRVAEEGHEEAMAFVLKAGLVRESACDRDGLSFAQRWLTALGSRRFHSGPWLQEDCRSHRKILDLLVLSPSSLSIQAGTAPLLVLAAQADLAEFVDTLLEHGASFYDADTENGACALHVAVQNGFFGVADRLVAAGADPNQCGGIFYTDPLAPTPETAEVERASPALLALLNPGWGYSASGRNRPGEPAWADWVEQELLPWGKANAVRWNATNAFHNGVLHAGEALMYPRLVAALIAAGASVSARNRDGDTPLLSALKAGAPVDSLRHMVDAGADVHAVNRTGHTALLQAAWGAKDAASLAETVDLLLAEPAALYARNTKGQGVLDISLERGREDQHRAWRAIQDRVRLEADVPEKRSPRRASRL